MKSPINGKAPSIDETSYVAPNATVVGDVTIGRESGIWFGAIVRGDVNSIRIGRRTSIQDLCVLHCDEQNPLSIGDDVTVGHGAILHGCTVGSRVLIGMGSTIMNGARIGDDTIVAAGAVVTEGMEVPARSLVAGVPAQVKRALSEDQISAIVENARYYVGYTKAYMK